MTGFEYKVVPAPTQGLKAKGVKGTPARFANALETVMNDMGAEGWEYQRSDTLPVEERQGLTGKTTTFQNMLVFRRTREATVAEPLPVAALIEDQTAVLTATSGAPEQVSKQAPAQTEVMPEKAAEPAAPSIADVAATPPQVPPKVEVANDATLTADAKDRVEKSLTEPFIFPWNRRSPTNGPVKDDSNVSAE